MAQRLIQSKKKPGITPKAQDSIIQQAISLLYDKGFHAKDTQVAYIQRLIYDCTNVILIAQTGFGKSLILQAVLILCKGTISLIFLPLNEIAKEQVQKVNEVGGNALFLNADIKNREQVIETAKTGKYTHIFTSPELASTLSFHSLL